MNKFKDDEFIHLERDITKLREKFSMYISYSGSAAAKALVLEMIYNVLDEIKSNHSPADKMIIEFDERTEVIRISDNGRGIPTDKLELVLTTLNSGSNIDSGKKVDQKINILGRNGVGTIAYTALSEFLEVTSYRGGTENIYKTLVFREGEKVDEKNGKCSPDKHGLDITFKPSKILGKNTRIIWKDLREEIVNLQFLEQKKFDFKTTYIDKRGEVTVEKFKIQPFINILALKNDKESMISDKIYIVIENDNVQEEVGGKIYKRFIREEIAFVFTNSLTPYVDSFANGNNTIDNGSHLDGVQEGICRYFQQAAKSSMSEKERANLDIKWDDVRSGLSLVVSFNSNMEHLFTSQTKHKVSNEDVEDLVKNMTIDTLQLWGESHSSQLRELINIVKLNAKVRREGEKVRSAVVKENLTNWGSFKMKNYDPCVNRGKEYKELFICEGDSAKGSLRLARFPKFQALFAIRGVSANVFKLDLNGILANREFADLIKVMGCNVGSKFDLSKLVFDKIIIATDADVDGYFIRALLLSFYFKLFPEIIEEGKLFIAEPPLYIVDSKKDPFVVNREDYIDRYIKDVIKNYQIGYLNAKDKMEFMETGETRKFLSTTSYYVDDLGLLAQHYKVNERLLEMILIYLAEYSEGLKDPEQLLSSWGEGVDPMDNPHRLMKVVLEEFPEIYHDDHSKLIRGIIDGKYQTIEVSDRLCRKCWEVINVIKETFLGKQGIVLRNVKENTENTYPMITAMKVLKKYQPTILSRAKGLGENTDEDLRKTVMDPNSRALIRVNIDDLNNDLKIFNMLRGATQQDLEARRKMMRDFTLPREFVDT